MRFLDVFRPAMRLLPETTTPDRRIPFNERMVWTATCLFMFMVLGEIRLYGVEKGSTVDPFYWLRTLMGSQQGTLRELGVAPILTAGMLMQFLYGSRLISADLSRKEDRALFQGAQKVIVVLVALVQASLLVIAGAFGPISVIGSLKALFLVAQMVTSSIAVMTMDELLQKGYGFGATGINTFIAMSVCEQILSSGLSFKTIDVGRGPEKEGALLALFQLSFRDGVSGLKEAMFRTGAGGNIITLLATVFIFVLVNYFQVFRVELPVKHVKARSHAGMYPIKLFYTGGMPIIIYAAFMANAYLISQVLYSIFPELKVIGILGRWEYSEFTGLARPTAGLAYYLSPPQSTVSIFTDPVNLIVFACSVPIACGIASRMWLNVSGTAARDIARQLKDQQMTMRGYRDSTVISVLDKYITPCAVVGGVVVGAIAVTGEILGAVGSGAGIVLAVTTIYQNFETMYKEGGIPPELAAALF
ncbi:protein transport protein Sec61 subunit alpha, putative [Perkinsus marinus ATCC 50983]|uniref:Protein transport protein Sec61 subunit alpha, putative n=1 Tax=Perkinsus marinus (strain ATCC 50983 / TXsc) TaxID=423536 RepID=C5LIF3_PERM5|nr:protein transport protein Sec61 subunit alpha, putative [Perkinsus marinus ATCC 50983]EER03356.1 protein transport protein Sec61 subunit alpha, putative [Perkinsus marinus ATCC 50983]|eukprot:XP_002771540.1 protein transport protein Sec61 subunit alpha, putative [Perkinsus marinus ATCC 50983]